MQFPKKQYVFLAAFVATAVAYLSVIGVMQEFTTLPLLPLAPLLLFFLVASIAPSLGGWVTAAIFFMVIYFAVCSALCIRLLKKRGSAWDFAIALYIGLILVNALYLLFMIPEGTRLYGPEIPRFVFFLDVAAAAVCGAILAIWKKWPHFPSLSLAAYGGLLLWISWFSFPYVGEMP